MSGRRHRIRRWFHAATLVIPLALLGFASVAMRSIAVSHRAAADAARADLAALEDASELQGMLYQKGFVADYFLTFDPRWLEELERVRPEFDRWRAGVTQKLGASPEVARAAAQLVVEYEQIDAERT